ncbi:hypothetical protein [Nostoc sp. FACHB-110]|uniref:hypothetical protein n=1 Tax=Nostoc sp. FACHB-110 TaxID=2692834 RepID=UPI0016863E16|nr:hypothetical protein [Nostoc sp. FACHB-110]MBD2439122.1 hypothetical protein [Nostoc sp. FACHB-110]
MKLIPVLSSGLIALSPIVFAQAALADGWPTSVVGNWSVNANNSTGTLSITTQATTGNCRSIRGSIFGNPITKGFYCPFSGRLHFIRDVNNSAFQVYNANVSQNATTLRIGGLFSDYAQPGEYSFFGSK